MEPIPAAAQPAGEFVRALVPEWALPVVLFVTFLGNVGFLLGLLTLDYWIGDRERGAHAIAVAIGGMALITLLKAFFAAPRPPPAVNVVPITGYSFPSGHALASPGAYGVLAADLRVGSRRSRVGVAAVLVAAVSLSRVALGVHFVRDVVAGVLLGLAFLAVAVTVTGRDPRRGFLLAAAVGAAAFAVSGASHDGTAVLGATVGAALTWESIAEVPRVEDRPRRVLLLATGVPLLAGLGYVATVPPLPLSVVFGLNAVLMAVVLTAPKLAVEA